MFKYELKRHSLKKESENFFSELVGGTITIDSPNINLGYTNIAYTYRNGDVRWDDQENKMYFFNDGEWLEINN
jgi:hypothetical protein